MKERDPLEDLRVDWMMMMVMMMMMMIIIIIIIIISSINTKGGCAMD